MCNNSTQKAEIIQTVIQQISNL